MELRNQDFRVPILSSQGEGNINGAVKWQGAVGHGGVREPEHAWTFQAREPGEPIGFRNEGWQVTARRNGQKTSRTVQLT